MSRYKKSVDRALGFAGECPPLKYVADRILHAGTTIFTFHRVLPRGADCFEPELRTYEDSFKDFLDWLETHYRIVPLDRLALGDSQLSHKGLPECAITFDDGWLDNFAYAFPQLRRRGLPATIFLPTSLIGTDRKLWQELLWCCTKELNNRKDHHAMIEKAAGKLPWFPPTHGDLTSYNFLKQLLLTRPSSEADEFTRRLVECAGLPENHRARAFVNWDEVKQMQAGGISFGSHTMNHTLLSNAAPRVAQWEIENSRRELREKIGGDVAGFAYPWGVVGPNSLAQLQEAGYQFAVTTKPGLVTKNCNRFLLPRVAVSEAILDGGKELFVPGKARFSFAKNILANYVTASVARTGKDPNRRIKILFVFDLITEWEGGTERQIRLLIQSLDRKYFEPKLCFMFKAPELAVESLPCPLLVVCPGSSSVPPAARLWRLVRLFRKERPDIVQGFFIEGLMMGILAGRIAKVPRVIGSTRNAGYWRKASHRFIMKVITPLAHRWQTNSRYLWRFQRDREGVPEDLIEILPNGTNLSGFKPASTEEKQCLRKKLGLNPEGPICVSVANLAKVKDLFTLINGAALLADRLPSIQFVLVGDGPLRDELALHADRRGVSKNIQFVGRHANVRPFLAAADVGVLTSTSEGSSNAVLEYVAMALPVVLTDIEPNRELVDGVFFQSGDAADFATKLLSLCMDLAQRAHGKIENRKNLTEFSVENMVMRAESFYARLVTSVQE